MGYPDLKSQINILRDRHARNPLDEIQRVITREQLLMMQEKTEEIHIADSIYDYIARLATATRNHEMIQLGLSPRGTLALCRMTKAYAFIMGRDYVIPEDVGVVFKDVCAHRLILSPKARVSDVKKEDLLTRMLKEEPLPQIKPQGTTNETL